MSYTGFCTALLDTSKQVLLDGKALVELIHNPQDDIDEKVMIQVRKSIEISEKLAAVANDLNQEFHNLFAAAAPFVAEKFHMHEQIFLNSANTVQNSMVILTRLTKSIISNVYMQTGIAISQDKVDNCCKNLTTSLKSMISAMEAIRKMADDQATKMPASPKINGQATATYEDIPSPSLDHGVVLEAACKTVREWVQKLVNLVLLGDDGGDRSDLEYAKNFYDVGRSTMNNMVKLINFAKKIGMPDEEARLKLLLFQLLSLSKSFNSASQITGALPEKQIQEINLVKVQIEESLWWFVKMAKLRCKYIGVFQEEPLDSSTPHPILALPPKPLPALPPNNKPGTASAKSNLSLSPNTTSFSPPTTLTRSSSNPPRVSLITPTSSAAKFEHSVTKFMTEEEEAAQSATPLQKSGDLPPPSPNNRVSSKPAPQEVLPETKPRASSKSALEMVSVYVGDKMKDKEPVVFDDRRLSTLSDPRPLPEPPIKVAVQSPDSPQILVDEDAPNSPTTEARLKSVLHVTNGAPVILSRSHSLASVKEQTTKGTEDKKARRNVVEIPPELLQGIIPANEEKAHATVTGTAAEARKRPVSERYAPVRASEKQPQVLSPREFKAAAPAAAKTAPEQEGSTTPRKTTFIPLKSAATSDKPPEIPAKPPGLKMTINTSQDRESKDANMTLRSGVLRRAHPQSVIFDTKKQSTMGAYMGDIDAQLLNFRNKITAHLEYILIDTYALNADDMQLLIGEKDAKVNTLWSNLQNPPTVEKKKDNKGKKNPNIKLRPFDDLTQVFSKQELEASSELARRLEAIIHTTFDQYEGLRQINDFRSIPDGQVILQTANITNTLLKKQLTAGSILIVYNFMQQVLTNKDIVKMYLPATKDEFLEMSRHEHNLKLATDNILLEYCKLKAGLLLQTGYVSSIVEQEHGFNLNHVIVDKFLTEIYDITEKCINTQADLFAKRAAEIEKIPKKRQKVIFTKFGGKEAFSHIATNTLALLRPWMRKWVDVQVPSIVQRELFAKDIDALKLALEESKNNMVASFQELLNNQVPEPLYKFDAILKSIDEELELASAIFSI